MNRFTFSSDAEQDLHDIDDSLDEPAPGPTNRISESIEAMFYPIAGQPYLGKAHSGLTRILGEEVRGRMVQSYRIYYRVGSRVPEIVAILHGAQDQDTILDRRFQ